jgi:cysteate synthase
MYGIENDAVYAGMETFLTTEGIDIVPASGVAVAILEKGIKTGAIGRNDAVLLNITGGGEARLRREKETSAVVPQFISKNVSEKEIEEMLCHILKKNS